MPRKAQKRPARPRGGGPGDEDDYGEGPRHVPPPTSEPEGLMHQILSDNADARNCWTFLSKEEKLDVLDIEAEDMVAELDKVRSFESPPDLAAKLNVLIDNPALMTDLRCRICLAMGEFDGELEVCHPIYVSYSFQCPAAQSPPP